MNNEEKQNKQLKKQPVQKETEREPLTFRTPTILLVLAALLAGLLFYSNQAGNGNKGDEGRLTLEEKQNILAERAALGIEGMSVEEKQKILSDLENTIPEDERLSIDDKIDILNSR